MTLKYFAYGSNMLHYRLWQRVPSCRVIDRVCLEGFSLNYFIRGVDDSGKCNIVETGNVEDSVHGVVFEMTRDDLPSLDAAEGESYHKRELILSGQNADHKAFAYLGNSEFIDPSLKPFDWYKAIVVKGAESHNLPTEYVTSLSQTEAWVDPDQLRSEKCFKILDSSVPE